MDTLDADVIGPAPGDPFRPQPAAYDELVDSVRAHAQQSGCFGFGYG